MPQRDMESHREAGGSAICADTKAKTRESSLTAASMKADIYNKWKDNALRIKIFIKVKQNSRITKLPVEGGTKETNVE